MKEAVRALSPYESVGAIFNILPYENHFDAWSSIRGRRRRAAVPRAFRYEQYGGKELQYQTSCIDKHSKLIASRRIRGTTGMRSYRGRRVGKIDKRTRA